VDSPLLSRNARCPCGSGRRYKDCHGAIGAAHSPAAMLALLERRLARVPNDPANWRAALQLLASGDVDDGAVAASAGADGTASLKVAVVTAYFREDLATLLRCHASVAAQTYPCRHIMVADGYARDEINTWPVEHVRLSHPSADYGDTPRAKGGDAAIASGCDAIAYLDADNTFRPHHVESLVARRQATGAPWCRTGRTLLLPDGRFLPVLHPDDSLGHVDTNCMLISGDVLAMRSAWSAVPRILSAIGDRVVVRMLRARGFAPAHTGALTVRYTVNEARFYQALGLAPPPTARAPIALDPIAAWYRGLGDVEREALDTTLGYPLADLLRPMMSSRGIAL
jgi:hypothetical protein